MRDKAFTDVRVDACTQLEIAGNDSLCLKLGSRVFLWPSNALSISLLFVLFVGFLDGVVLQSVKGSTVGKMCMRLSVVDGEGLRAHPMRMFGRWAMLVIDIGFFFVGCIIVGATHPHRRLGDFVFGTYVVSMSRAGRPISEWMEGGLGRGGAGVALPSVGEPAIWTAPPLAEPVPALAAPSPPPRPAAPVVPVETPPGTAPTTPGEWGAVARPAPLVRTPEWTMPPTPSEESAPPVDTNAKSTQWAAPPKMRDSEDADDSADDDSPAEDSVDEEVEAETETEAESEPDEELEAELGDDDEESSAQWKPVESVQKNGSHASADENDETENDESWWDAALSSGDSEDES
jgi:hypothetical protein